MHDSAQCVDKLVADQRQAYSYVLKNAEYKKSVKKDIKGRKMTLVGQEEEGEEDMEIWTYHCQDAQVRPQKICFIS